jgi:hypothetical protein
MVWSGSGRKSCRRGRGGDGFHPGWEGVEDGGRESLDEVVWFANGGTIREVLMGIRRAYDLAVIPEDENL